LTVDDVASADLDDTGYNHEDAGAQDGTKCEFSAKADSHTPEE